ncbi:MFS transporter [Paenibacillus humicola]|uniref:MFS transporter n=1 Tax=Paenibacillus humicola TaxID=3110540 RepID=UPI00237A6A92|nr:MFS transporter [Paenibacillus humicola]
MNSLKQQFETLGSIIDRIQFRSVHKWLIFLIALGAVFDAIEQYNIGYAAPLLTQQWGLSKTEVGLLTTLTFGGMAVGSLIAGILGDLIGRRITYMYNLGLYTFGALIAAFAPNLEILLLGRFIVGLGLGGELNTGITIVSEFVPTKNRGSSVAIVNVAAGGLGIFLSAAIAYLILGPFSAFLGGDEVTWRWLLGILAAPAVLLWIYRKYIPESPRYLMSRGKVDELNRVLSIFEQNTLKAKKLRIKKFFDSVAGTYEKEKVRFRDIFSAGLAKRTVGLWIISALTFGAQVAITVFMPSVLVEQGFTIVNSLFYSMVINTGGLVGAILSSYFAAKLGRKMVLGWGSLIAFAIALLFGLSQSTFMILLLGSILQLMFMLLNTTTWLYAPEIYPTRIRAFGTGASVVVALVSASLIPYLAGYIFEIGKATGLLSMIAIMYAIMGITTWKLGVETKGKSLEQLSEADVSINGASSTSGKFSA